MKIIKPPNNIISSSRSVFLAGSIEMGKAINWQSEMENLLSGIPGVIYNPRRDDWDSTWVQSINSPQFFEQVTWELTALESASVIALYFAAGTKSPISLLELGLFARTGKVIVCCPEGFWRKGNVDIVCARYNISQANNISALAKMVISQIESEE